MKGIMIFARDNEHFSYGKMACAAASLARKNLSGFDEICLVTDDTTFASNEDVISSSFDRVIKSNSSDKANPRMFKDTLNITNIGDFKNTDRANVFAITPYDETMVIDADYFVMSNVLDGVWGSKNDFMINYKYHDISGRGNTNVTYIDDFTIPMCWATVFYFRKTEYTENIFFMIDHIKNNYDYYSRLYNCPGKMFRNDFAFSIALHILNGGIASNIPSLPIEYLNNSYDLDDIFRVNSHNDVLMFCTNADDKSKHILGRFTNMDLHIMNKFAVQRHLDRFLEVSA